jgi:hypothetical protein
MEKARQERLAFKANGTGGRSGETEISDMIAQVSGASLSQIEMLIGELGSIRNLLVSESQRMQAEIAQYVRLNQTAIESTRIIRDSLPKSKPEGVRGGLKQSR